MQATVALVIVSMCAKPALAETTTAIISPYASAMRSINPRLRAPQSLAYATALLDNARDLHVDPTLVMAVVTVESHWNARATSDHGAQGLGQLKPETARELGVDPWSARSNLHGITLYLHQLLSLFHAAREPIQAAIAGYNAGPFAVGASGRVPQNGQTPRYVRKVMLAWHALRARLGAAPSPDDVAANLTPASVSAAQTAYWGVR